MKKEAYEVEYYETKSVLAMQADRQEGRKTPEKTEKSCI